MVVTTVPAGLTISHDVESTLARLRSNAGGWRCWLGADTPTGRPVFTSSEALMEHCAAGEAKAHRRLLERNAALPRSAVEEGFMQRM